MMRDEVNKRRDRPSKKCLEACEEDLRGWRDLTMNIGMNEKK